MDRDRVNDGAEIESSTGQGAGLLELWNGTGQSVWYYVGVCHAGSPSGLFRSESGPTLAGMVLWGSRQTRAEASRTGREHMSCTGVAVDPGLVACGSTTTGAGLRCDDALEALHGA